MRCVVCVGGLSVTSCHVLEGYGQTEGTVASTLTVKEDVAHTSNVGIPLACNEIKLVSVEDMGYRYDDTKHVDRGNKDKAGHASAETCKGRGEICIRGTNVFQR